MRLHDDWLNRLFNGDVGGDWISFGGYWRGLTYYEQILLNVLFNLGYTIQDAMWLVQVTGAETDYFYRVGFVLGDIYIRVFFRSYVGAPVV